MGIRRDKPHWKWEARDAGQAWCNSQVHGVSRFTTGRPYYPLLTSQCWLATGNHSPHWFHLLCFGCASWTSLIIIGWTASGGKHTLSALQAWPVTQPCARRYYRKLHMKADKAFWFGVRRHSVACFLHLHTWNWPGSHDQPGRRNCLNTVLFSKAWKVSLRTYFACSNWREGGSPSEAKGPVSLIFVLQQQPKPKPYLQEASNISGTHKQTTITTLVLSLTTEALNTI